MMKYQENMLLKYIENKEQDEVRKTRLRSCVLDLSNENNPRCVANDEGNPCNCCDYGRSENNPQC